MATWTTSQCPFAIEYIPQVLEDIGMAVVSAFHWLSHGGLEIGGILLGSHYDDRITITDFRPMLCEHAFGPTFQLSADDHVRLATAIAGAQATGQTIVGWFHSHTRTGVFLSEADLEIQNRHFVEPWQVALVLRPVLLKPTLFGFFFREVDGSIHSDESYQEFELEGRTSNDLQAKMSSPGLDGPAVNVLSAPQSRHPRGKEELPQTSQEPAAALPPAAGPPPPVPPPMDAAPNREAAIASPAAGVSQPWEDPRKAKPRRQSGRLHIQWARVLVGATIILVLGATYAFLSRSEPEVQATRGHRAADQAFGVEATRGQPAAGQALGLKMQRQGPDLALTWNRNLPEVLGATAGLLTIKDGLKRKEMGLSAEQLRSANILIAPESDHVEVQLVVLLPNQRIMSESGIVILPAQSLAAQTTASPVVPNATVPLRTYAGAQIKPKSPNVNESKVLGAPPHPNQAPVTPPMDKPPALKVMAPAERTQPSSPTARKSPPSLPSAATAAEPTRAEGPVPVTVVTAAPEGSTGQTAPGSTSPGSPPTPLRVGGNAKPAELIWRKNPIYPPVARSVQIQGVVALEGLVGTDGRVKALKVISGRQMFRQAALDAVSKWVYKPARLNGEAIESPLRVEILFRKDM